MKSTFQQIMLLSFILYLSSLVICPTPNTEITYDEEPNFTALPNEFPDLSSYYLLFGSVNQQNILKLKNVIGYLPFNEQIALMKSINNRQSTYFFNFDDYKTHIKNYFDEQEKAIGDYITQHERTLSYGIGCLKAVSNKYASKSEYNQQMQTIIYNSIDAILNAQSMNNQCQAEFLEALQSLSVYKRANLFSIETGSNGKIIDNKDIFVYDLAKENIIGFRYPSGIEGSVVPKFKQFALCQNIYTNILATSAMQAEIALANMDECRDYDNPNNNAGNSSDVYDNPSIAYRKNDKQKGINNGNLVRADQKTFNGYLLNHGFNFGKATYKNKYSVFSKYDDIINTALNGFSNGISLYATIKTKEAHPFSGLVKDIIEILLVNDASTQSFINEYKLGCSSSTDYTLQYFSSPTPSCSLIPSRPCSLISVTNSNLSFNSFTLYGKCSGANTKMTVIVHADHPLLGDVFDIEYNNGEGVGAKTTSTIQACMASFSSGGSNDKDACRDVITKKCGMNIDYQCKKSGFYDYINANPNSVPLPPDCTTGNDVQCFKWIERFFFAGQFVVKPSAFIGYNLYLSTSTKEKDKLLESMNYQEPDLTGSIRIPTAYPTISSELQTLHSTASNKISILGTGINSQADISEKTVLMDKGAYKILHDGAKSLNYGLSILLFTIALLI